MIRVMLDRRPMSDQEDRKVTNTKEKYQLQATELLTIRPTTNHH